MTYAIRNKAGAITRELGTDRIEAWGAWDRYAKGIRVTAGDELVMQRDGAWVVLAYMGPVRSEKRAWFGAGDLEAKHRWKRRVA